MKQIRLFVMIAAALLMAAVTTQAQTKEEIKSERKAEHARYSRWSIGANIGVPFTRGDMTSFSADKLYLGVIGGLQATYQLTPTFGLTWTGDYGQNKAGHKSYEADFVLKPDGWIVPGGMNVAPAGSAYFRDLYAKESYFLTGLHFDINLFRLFAPNRQEAGRFTVVLSPGLYLQKFSPTVYSKSNDRQFASTLTNNLDYGLGGNLALRYRVSPVVDLQLKGNLQFIHNQNFDGIVNTAEHELARPIRIWYTRETNVMVGVIFKLGNGNNKKRDNLIWATNYVAPKRAAEPEPAPEPAPEPQPQTRPAPAPKPAPAPVVAQTETITLPTLPTVHFKRGNGEIDTKKYRSQLDEIVAVLKRYPEADFRIEGYCDKTGTEAANKRLSEARAKALEQYLLGHGINAARIISVEGKGVDTALDAKDILNEKARRAAAITIEKTITRTK